MDQLRSLEAPPFIAGVVPLMRPFLSAPWAALATTNDGANFSARNVAHARRAGHGLDQRAAEWKADALGENASGVPEHLTCK